MDVKGLFGGSRSDGGGRSDFLFCGTRWDLVGHTIEVQECKIL